MQDQRMVALREAAIGKKANISKGEVRHDLWKRHCRRGKCVGNVEKKSCCYIRPLVLTYKAKRAFVICKMDIHPHSHSKLSRL